MRFDGSFGDVQIFSNFRVVTSLEKQIDDLTFPWAHLIELLFHGTAPLRCDPDRCKWLATRSLGASGFGSLCLTFAFTRPKRSPDVNYL